MANVAKARLAMVCLFTARAMIGWPLRACLARELWAHPLSAHVAVATALLLIHLPSVAQDRLFAARIVVEDRQEASLARAASEALEQVLVRVSGNRAVITLPGVAQAVSSARDRLSLYTYVEDETGLALIAEFDGVIVKDLLRAAGATYWGGSRPPVLIWLVVDHPDGRRFANQQDDAELLTALRAAFDERGVDIRLPLMDLEDSLVLGPNVVWQRVVPRIMAASKRYGTDHVLVGRHVELSSGRLLSDWLYLQQVGSGPEYSTATTQTEAEDYVVATEDAADLAVDAMAQRYAISLNEASRQGRLTVTVEGVYSFEDYQQVVALFNEITLLDGVRVAGIAGQQLRLSVSGLASGSELQRLIDPRTGLSIVAIDDDSDLGLLWEGGKP